MDRYNWVLVIDDEMTFYSSCGFGVLLDYLFQAKLPKALLKNEKVNSLVEAYKTNIEIIEKFKKDLPKQILDKIEEDNDKILCKSPVFKEFIRTAAKAIESDKLKNAKEVKKIRNKKPA